MPSFGGFPSCSLPPPECRHGVKRPGYEFLAQISAIALTIYEVPESFLHSCCYIVCTVASDNSLFFCYFPSENSPSLSTHLPFNVFLCDFPLGHAHLIQLLNISRRHLGSIY